MLEIKNLNVTVEEKQILKNLNLNIGKGEVHAIMGPNGSGKSTIAHTLAGKPNYNVCLLYTSPSPRDDELSRMPSSA